METLGNILPASDRIVSPPPFAALSLDLWFTTVYFETADELEWKAARLRCLAERVRDSEGHPIPVDRLESATEAARSWFLRTGRALDTVAPELLVAEIQHRLGATLAGGLDEAAERYSAAGLESHPPRLEPEVASVCRELERRGVPVIAISNTARTEASWRDAFSRIGGPKFRHVVTSCEVGAAKPSPEIFREGARRLGLPPGEILHVGDRWELDVAGAQDAGFGCALYRGLWPRYVEAGYQRTSLPPNEPAIAASDRVRRIDRLRELLDPDLFAAAPV